MRRALYRRKLSQRPAIAATSLLQINRPHAALPRRDTSVLHDVFDRHMTGRSDSAMRSPGCRRRTSQRSPDCGSRSIKVFHRQRRRRTPRCRNGRPTGWVPRSGIAGRASCGPRAADDHDRRSSGIRLPARRRIACVGLLVPSWRNHSCSVPSAAAAMACRQPVATSTFACRAGDRRNNRKDASSCSWSSPESPSVRC